MESGSYSSQPGATFELRHFSAALVAEGNSAPDCFEKLTVVSHAEIFASTETLTTVFTSKLKKGNSKIRNFKLAIAADHVTLSGTIKKVVPIEFALSGPVDTDGSRIMLHVTGIRTDGVAVKDLLALFGKNLSSVMNVKNLHGVAVEKDTISFDPEQLAKLKGHIESVRTTDKGLELNYAPAHARERHEAK